MKIVEAEDLPATDANGLSDPYVILGDEKQRRLHKTRVVNKSLNPRWDESVDVNVTGPTNIVATVWDNDLIGEDDFVGRTSLKLDPVHFNDYLPREYWLDLDTRGRLLVRVSMEGERDDIEFYFAKAFRLLKRTERDMTRTITAKVGCDDSPISESANVCKAFPIHQLMPVEGHHQSPSFETTLDSICHKHLEEAASRYPYPYSS